jgi:hypothetical protein
MNQLANHHNDEVESLKKLNEDGQKALRESIERKCQLKTDELVAKAIAETKIEMEQKLSELVDKEVAQQVVTFREEIENTVKNLEINDRDRMEAMKDQCLKAMELQSELMECRHATELIQSMILQKRQCSHTKTNVNLKQQTPKDHQSKSIKHLWVEFMKRFDDVDGEKLDADERKIFDKIHHLRGELMMGLVDELFIIREASAVNFDGENETQSDSNDANFNIPPKIEIKWEKSQKDEIPDDNFTSKVFNRFMQPQNLMHRRSSTISNIVSSIINMVRESSDEKLLEEQIALLIQDVIMRKVSVDSTAVDVVPMPKTEALHIRDSVEVMEEKHVQ